MIEYEEWFLSILMRKCDMPRMIWNWEKPNFTLNLEIGGRALRIADAVGRLARILAGVVGLHGIDDQRAVGLELGARLQPRDRLDCVVLAVPGEGDVGRQAARLAHNLRLVAFDARHVHRRHDDHGATCGRYTTKRNKKNIQFIIGSLWYTVRSQLQACKLEDYKF